MTLPKIHILGAGNIGCLVANALAAISAAPPIVNLILRSDDRVREYQRYGSSITVKKPIGGALIDVTRGVNAVSAAGLKEPISNLIVTVKTSLTESALRSVLPAITPNTNILLLQNGMGVYEHLCDKFWPEKVNRPIFHLGVTNHGVKPTQGPEWSFVHAGDGTVKVSSLNESSQTAPILTELVRADLNAEILPFNEFIFAQYDKLLTNAIINPLTALYGCHNGELLSLSSIEYLLSKIIGEGIRAITSHLDSKSSDSTALDPSEIDVKFAYKRMRSVVVETIKLTADNKSSMYQDVQKASETEIDYINGYICLLGQRYGVPTLHNKMLVEMVKGRVSLERDREKRTVPIVS